MAHGGLPQSLLQGGASYIEVAYRKNLSVTASGMGQSHRRLQKAVREFVDEYIYPDAQERELDGKRPSQSVLDKMA